MYILNMYHIHKHDKYVHYKYMYNYMLCRAYYVYITNAFSVMKRNK